MLTIKNFNQLFRKDVIGGYRIAKAIENETNYEIKLVNRSSGHSATIYLERDAIGGEYEMWVQKWLKAERMFFDKTHFETMDKFIGCLRLLG